MFLASMGRVNVTTENMNIVEDTDSVLKLGSGLVLNIKKGIRDCLAILKSQFPKI